MAVDLKNAAPPVVSAPPSPSSQPAWKKGPLDEILSWGAWAIASIILFRFAITYLGKPIGMENFWMIVKAIIAGGGGFIYAKQRVNANKLLFLFTMSALLHQDVANLLRLVIR